MTHLLTTLPSPAPALNISASAPTLLCVSLRCAVKGYAWSGGGRDIIRVDVSIDGGVSWRPSKLQKKTQREGRAWAWSLFEVCVCRGGGGCVSVCARLCGCEWLCVAVYAYVCVCVWLCVRAFVSACLRVDTFFVCVSVCMRLCEWLCVAVYV